MASLCIAFCFGKILHPTSSIFLGDFPYQSPGLCTSNIPRLGWYFWNFWRVRPEDLVCSFPGLGCVLFGMAMSCWLGGRSPVQKLTVCLVEKRYG
ncbi:hypothetical protein B0T21DRAFT_358109 [Apiosordaria backusii]|uniref:Uncharacterized protein n=1 Tax=Apiosordaria backusii TaxID=314023 RepID=A0AA40K3K4_9PEZI|nr:hypothetical protein B0T21DRAFT_358109 [Apiosordaria backusii]